MVGISTVVTMLLAVLLIQGQSLQKRIQENEQRKEELLAETETEQERTSEIEDMEEYMQSDEYIEKIAREKIGLVKDNEIIFKEVK
ncbi:MAG: septum formation initiator family protein [Clostridiales bacterium]|uniref:Septum formation initiator family protein n=1 Tax=Candidatus Pullilachnospira stercoravium TaxID=2840913 RepID=A0A9D1T6H0_9FIRM|nr:septum formation initiator family protein [Clostridiales bacterium]HIV12839.1 septum formation initiator family protein [Candidatus Pullilachnospira stercoravium]